MNRHWTDPTAEPEIYRPNPTRARVLTRLTEAGRKHARYHCDRAGRQDRPGPHALVFFFTPRRGTDGAGPTVTIAHRSFLHGPDVLDLSDIIDILCERAHEFRAGGAHNLFTQLADGGDPITRQLSYLGVGTSSVHADSSTTASIGGLLDVTQFPGWEGWVHLHDGTRMHLRSTSTLSPPSVVSTHLLTPARPDWRLGEPGGPAGLARLHRLLVDAEPARRGMPHLAALDHSE